MSFLMTVPQGHYFLAQDHALGSTLILYIDISYAVVHMKPYDISRKNELLQSLLYCSYLQNIGLRFFPKLSMGPISLEILPSRAESSTPSYIWINPNIDGRNEFP